MDVKRIAMKVGSGGKGLKPGNVVEGVGEEVMARAKLTIGLALGLEEVNGIEEGDEVRGGMAKAREVPKAGEAHGNAEVAVMGIGGNGGDGNHVGRGGGVGDGKLLGGDERVLKGGELRFGKGRPGVGVVKQRGVKDGM